MPCFLFNISSFKLSIFPHREVLSTFCLKILTSSLAYFLLSILLNVTVLLDFCHYRRKISLLPLLHLPLTVLGLWLHGLSVALASGGWGCSTQAARCGGFSCGAQAPARVVSVVVAPRLQSTGLVLVALRFSCLQHMESSQTRDQTPVLPGKPLHF